MPSKKHKPEEIIGKLREVEILLAHSAEWTIRPRTVSGHKVGRSARMRAAIRAPSAVAALVSPVVVSKVESRLSNTIGLKH